MDLRQLRSFLKVADLLSFSRAARQLHLSQPALSTQIKQLEESLGVKLLERNRRVVQLTEAGKTLRQDGEQLLAQVEDTARHVRRVADGVEGHLRIAFVASAATEIVPAIVLAFRKRYPGVSLELKNLPTVQQVEALRAGNLDAGFVRMPLHVEEFAVERIHREPFAVVMPKGHALSKVRGFTMEQLSGEAFVSYGRRWAPEFFESWTGICRRAGFTPSIVQETAEMETAIGLVAAGLGVAILPEGMAKRHRRMISMVPLGRETIQSEIGIAMPRGQRSTLVEHLLLIAKSFSAR